jgi:hypothetical protein
LSLSRTRSFAAVAFSFAMIASTAAIAQDDLRARGDRACRTDAPRLCKAVLGQGDMVVLSCFQQNRTKLTASCRKFLIEVGQLPPG